MGTAEERRQKQYELMDRICCSVCEGNEIQAVRAARERNCLGMPGQIDSDLTEWKYELVRQETLMIQSLRGIGVSEVLLDGARERFTKKIYAAASARECKALSEEMAVCFCRMNEKKQIHTASLLIQKVLLTVESDLCEPLTLQYFAGLLNVNGSYLSGLFRKETGQTLTEYVTARRIAYASELLVTTRHPIKLVARQAGIPDVQYFSRIFKKRTGRTPSQYRKSGPEKLS